jgi:hypothetical protein
VIWIKINAIQRRLTFVAMLGCLERFRSLD